MRLETNTDSISIRLGRWEKIWAVHGDLTISKAQIVEARTGWPERSWRDLRVPGTYAPGLLRAGTYRTRRGKEFWYAYRGRPYVTVELRDHHFVRLVLATPDADAWVERINALVAAA